MRHRIHKYKKKNPLKVLLGLIEFCLILFAAYFLFDYYSPKTTIQSDYFSVNMTTSGRFEVVSKKTNWDFAGRIQFYVNDIKKETGSDNVGNYSQLDFQYSFPDAKKGSIRIYDNKPVVLFDSVFLEDASNNNIFPTFTSYPNTPHHLTYQGLLANAKFDLKDKNSPWIFFDDNANTAVLSPASHFMISSTQKSLTGDISSGIDPTLTDLPKDFDQKTILVVDSGINQTIDLWGNALTDLQGKVRPANDSDITLNELGYWTDNGASYYYHFDPKIGNYPDTLLAVKKEYEQKNVPIKYMQLDSWWYGPKDNEKGTLLYEADPSVWVDKASGKTGNDALKIFQQKLGLPTTEHARWLGPNSPYRTTYDVSNGVAIDPLWWQDRMAYLKNTANSVMFEQDWLYGPSTTKFNLTDPEKFMDEMAKATKDNGLVMQYCLAVPQDYLQGSKYSNLSTIRVSGDIFGQDKWEEELWTSKYAASLGIWPWVDVFKSNNIGDILLADLSAGIVGPGDALGTVNAANIMKVVRADSVIVKPDVPMVPIDRMYLEQAKGNTNTPMISSTYSDFGNTKAYYVTVFSRPYNVSQPFSFKPTDFGATGNVFIYDFFNKKGIYQKAEDTFEQLTPKDTLTYFIVVPVSNHGIAFLGDQGKFVSLGKKRISSLDVASSVSATVTFAANEKSITLFGYANLSPVISMTKGSSEKVAYNKTTKQFTVIVHPGKDNTAQITIN